MNFKRTSTIAFVAFSILISSCESDMHSSNELLQQLNRYCVSKGQANLDKTQS
jgi:hypothetical protein